MANAISYLKWGDRPKYRNVFFHKPSIKLTQLLESCGLKYSNENKTIQRNDVRYRETLFEKNEISWTHFIAVFAAQYTHNKIAGKNHINSIIIPLLRILGVSIPKMMGDLDSSLERAYLFSLGGDILQDRLFNIESPWDYRGDILGLSVLKDHTDLSGKLSQFISEGYEKRYLVENEKFRNHNLYIEGKEYSNSERLKLFLGFINTKFYDSFLSGKKLKRSPLIKQK